ncbi:uncharacterized protein PV09_01623 [Verruconis gallopava]|uniref:HTH APSES-type domain-containing protein n=1 Tax=Verruconis gallopava TaxID=253628 RepID=A0A0D2ALN5_9PEZI|nr:uncharacterized protein PV09_01623 [Verruconis gallopava]KIW07683.1 hypothetical protein PV09_01623 [Verruconis gallopava]
MKVEELLNPSPTEEPADSITQPPQPAASTLQTPALTTHKPYKNKMPKDAPIFRKGPTKGDVLFPPHEAEDDDELAKHYEHFHIYPRGEIAQHCHHIPYSSDKKTFLSKTGRDAFEVFQYTFRLPGEDREYVVMWDYNIGLVRITPFFKCCKYSKTTPAKVLNANPGLRDISHSITGGALSAQGYWMPFACAKAVAATFCFHIRYALTPLFGKDFADLCVRPTDATFANFKIDSSIIKACTIETQQWLQRADAHITPGSSCEQSETPGTSRVNVPSTSLKRPKPRLPKIATSPESGYGTDSEWSDCAHDISPRSTWQAVNKPRDGQKDAVEVNAAETLLLLSSPKTKTPQMLVVPANTISVKASSKKNNCKRLHDELEHVSDEKQSPHKPGLSINRERIEHGVPDSRAALVLLQFRARGATICTVVEDKHREKRQRRNSVPHQIP